MIALGVTGGIGSGKSTIAELLASLARGRILDADHIARAVTLADGSAIPALREAFGPQILSPDGSMNRGLVRQRAFAEPGFRSRLEGIIHPLVRSEFLLQEEDARKAGVPLLIFDIPLLVESTHWRNSLQHVLVADCSEETQVQRVQKRNGLDSNAVRAIINAQAPRLRRLAAADIVVFNDGIGMQQLEKQCQQVCTILGLHTLAKDSA